MRYLTVEQIERIHKKLIERSGGSSGLRDREALESAVAQPMMTFGREELYPTLAAKAAAIGFSLIQNHAFVDGNKCIGHAAMEVMLVINGYELHAAVDEQERVVLEVASGHVSREAFTEWVRSRLTAIGAADNS